MMRMTFVNDRGSIDMDGGGGDGDFKIISVEGLGYVAQNAVTASYPFSAGQRTLSRSCGPRLITVAADAASLGKRHEDFVSGVAHDEGRLYISDNGKNVYIDCYVSNLSVTNAWGREYERYVIQFTCDYPYFRDATATVGRLFERTKLIKDAFTLPTVFSERVTDSRVTVEGDKEVYPKIVVGSLSVEADIPLTIQNETTGATLCVNLPQGEYSTVELDLREGKITADGEDMLYCLDEDCYMSDFYLVRGENRIKVTAMDNAAHVLSALYFENEYFSAREDDAE